MISFSTDKLKNSVAFGEQMSERLISFNFLHAERETISHIYVYNEKVLRAESFEK